MMLDAFLILASVTVGFCIGQDWRKMHDDLAKTEPVLRAELQRELAKEEVSKPKHTATVVDGDDQAMAAKVEYEERMSKLNPEIHHEDK